jgi:hypothetical protein
MIELPREIAEFIIENCDSNLRLGIQLLDKSENEIQGRKIVRLIENFRTLKTIVEKAMK